MVTLKPGVPVIRKIDIGALVKGLVDGLYKIWMQSRVCWWWHGEFGMEKSTDGRVQGYSCGIIHSSLMLELQNEVTLCIRDEKID